MSYIKINGKKKLSGTVQISGAKNSVLPLIIATTMTDSVVNLEGIPDIRDVRILKDILSELGSTVIISEVGHRKNFTIDNKEFINKPLLMKEITEFRASYYFMGSMVARYKKCELLLPGGCFLGPRPIDLHIMGLEQLGCKIDQTEEKGQTKISIDASNGLKGNNIFLDFPSVGATINLMLAACLASGETTIENAAKEPEIVDVATLLNNMGAKIKGAGTNEIRVHGVEKLEGCNHQVVPDRIEAGTYLMIGSAIGEDFTVNNVIPEHLEALTSKLLQMGADLEVGEDYITVNKVVPLKGTKIKVGVYPSFATDLQQVFMTLATTANGETSIIETIYPDRFRQAPYLVDMGANIDVELGEETSHAKIYGATELVGKDVKATDLRAGASLIMAGLLADGETKITNIRHILRGYDSIVEKLNNVGADICLIEER